MPEQLCRNAEGRYGDASTHMGVHIAGCAHRTRVWLWDRGDIGPQRLLAAVDPQEE